MENSTYEDCTETEVECEFCGESDPAKCPHFGEIESECGKYKKYLIELTNAVSSCLNEQDKLMKQPSTAERGRQIGALLNQLDYANDLALHFGLDLSFKKIAARKK